MVAALLERRWTMAELADQFAVTTRTVRRDLQLIGEFYALRNTNDHAADGYNSLWWIGR
jgi:transcriptional antiterminator